MNDFLQTAIITATPIFSGYIVWLLKQQKGDHDANSKGTMLLLRMELIRQHTYWIKKEYITPDALDNYNELYEAYHGLHGNGLATKMQKEINALPIKGGTFDGY